AAELQLCSVSEIISGLAGNDKPRVRDLRRDILPDSRHPAPAALRMSGGTAETNVFNHVPVWNRGQPAFLEVLIDPLIVPDAPVSVSSRIEIAAPEIPKRPPFKEVFEYSF